VVRAGIKPLRELRHRFTSGEIMAPIICFIAAFVNFRIPGLELHCLVDWHMALRAALGAMFLLAPSAHWAKRRTKLIRMVPESLGNTGIWVSVTGFAEIAIAADLQIPRVKLWVAGIAVIMLCCLFPANVRAAREHLTISQKPGMQVAPCLILQNFFIAALIRSVWPGR
jgi:uncharacterized membrane protein